MNELQKVLDFIDEYYRQIFRRPGMYFSKPEACEDVVFMVESIRDFIVGGLDDTPPRLMSYSDFLGQKGFGSAGFTTRFKEWRGEEGYTEREFYTNYFLYLEEYLEQTRGTPFPIPKRRDDGTLCEPVVPDPSC